MNQSSKPYIVSDPWAKLQQFTDARIGLGRCGTSMPTEEVLKFKLSHAQARDAVHQPVQTEAMASKLQQNGFTPLVLHSSVQDRSEYLTRPDKGRSLSQNSVDLLTHEQTGYDICVVICDGLSAPAIHESALDVTIHFLNIVRQSTLTASPVCMVTNGRVAIGDQIGHLLQARMVVLLIGERPGLSSPNSLGAYLTYAPLPGLTDESRNCISNIRKGGMSTGEAVRKIAYLVEEAFTLKHSGVALKDRMNSDYIPLLSFQSKVI
ncbi:ethanolamine ammonia-lyase subunit EutC [Desulfogranum japonicum]|uniref:ethanolamine ammonia-lyase subunit EutC n=1 Tax=Desulfogranum japonicum TaxID=231447 RepID=UPI000409D366|nr:ethanolamine ammonia-lyase subunit EutC [Desulfogranum japonicum]